MFFPFIHTCLSVSRIPVLESLWDMPPSQVLALCYVLASVDFILFLESIWNSPTHRYLLCFAHMHQYMLPDMTFTAAFTSTIAIIIAISMTIVLSTCMACRQSWKLLAAGKAPPDPKGAADGQHVHLQFCNMIINDSTYLLGEALEKLPQVSMACRFSYIGADYASEMFRVNSESVSATAELCLRAVCKVPSHIRVWPSVFCNRKINLGLM